MKNAQNRISYPSNTEKVIVFLKEKKTNFETDKRLNRLPSTQVISKSDILYVTSADKNGNKEYRRVVTTKGTFYSQHPLKDWANILSNGIQVNKSNVLNADYISNTNEWFYAYIQVGDELIPFEVMEDYRQTFKAMVASFCTLPWKRNKAG